MWVRSQNKDKFINCNIFYMYDFNIWGNFNEIVYGLGRYETEKRALEVLDEMQKCLLCVLQGEAHVYEMPLK